MNTLIVALIQNAGLLLALVFIFDFLSVRRNFFSTRWGQAPAGLAIGIVGVAMIVVAVPLETGVIFDTRSVLMAVCGLFLGTVPTLIAMAMAAVFRLMLGGIAAMTGVAVIIATGLLGLAWRHLRRRPLEQVTWQELYGFGLVVHVVLLGLMFTLPVETALRVLRAISLPVMVVHPLATVAVGLLFTQRLRNHLAAAETVRLLDETERSHATLVRLLEEKQASEERLHAARQLAQSTLDALRQNICVLDDHGSIIAVNRAWRDFAAANGGSQDEPSLMEVNYLSVCERATGSDETQAREVGVALRKVLEGEIDSFSLEYPCHSPTQQRWFHLQITRFANEGPVRVVVAHEDITARRKAEEERLELTAQLHQAQRLESLGALAGGVAHDINNVLTAILSLATAHRKQLGASDPLARSLDSIKSACVRGRSVVRSLLYFARSEVVSRGPVNLNNIVAEIVQLLSNTTLKRVAFNTELEESLPAIIGDAGALSHALMNLCINSLDAMPEGGSVTVRTSVRPGGTVEVSVRDTGVGMTPQIRAKAVDPFFTTKPIGKGTGLGLSMVFGTVTAHDGSFDIISTPGGGTEVILTFPVSSGAPLASTIEESAGDDATDANGLHVLIVDDDELIAEAVSTLLEMEGHKVSVSNSGEAALSRFQEGFDPDLVLLDMNMPGMNGAQTLTRLLDLRPEQVVLLCSGHWDDRSTKLTDRPNVSSLGKPFTLDEFDEKLRKLGLKA